MYVLWPWATRVTGPTPQRCNEPLGPALPRWSIHAFADSAWSSGVYMSRTVVAAEAASVLDRQ